MANEPSLVLQVTSGEPALRARVNGAVFFQDAGGEGREGFTTRVALDEWLLPHGRNVASFEVTPTGRASKAVHLAVRYPEDYKDPLVELLWSAPGGAEKRPFSVELPFTPDVEVKTKLWTDAEVLDADTFTPDAQLAAVATAMRLYGAFVTGDGDRIAELVQYRAEDGARALDTSPGDIVDSYTRVLQRPEPAFAPVVPDELEVTLVGGRRAVQVTRKGQPLIEALAVKYWSPVTLGVTVALIDREWRIVR